MVIENPDDVPLPAETIVRRRVRGDTAPVLAELGEFLSGHQDAEVTWRVVDG